MGKLVKKIKGFTIMESMVSLMLIMGSFVIGGVAYKKINLLASYSLKEEAIRYLEWKETHTEEGKIPDGIVLEEQVEKVGKWERVQQRTIILKQKSTGRVLYEKNYLEIEN